MTAAADIRAIRVGDVVSFNDGLSGPVVFNSATGDWSEGFPQEEWAYLGPGIMVKTLVAGYVFCDAEEIASGDCRPVAG